MPAATGATGIRPTSHHAALGRLRGGRGSRARCRRVEAGLVEEVKDLLAEEKPLSKQAAAAIGYAEMIAHLDGQMELDETVEKIKINTRRFAKSQRTWFKTFRNVHWIDIAEDDTVETVLEQTLTILE